MQIGKVSTVVRRADHRHQRADMNNDMIPGFDDEKDDSLKIRLQKIDSVDKCLVFYLAGYIDTYNSNYFQKRVNKGVEAGYVRLIFHCGGLNYVSSTGIGSFTAFLKMEGTAGLPIRLFPSLSILK